MAQPPEPPPDAVAPRNRRRAVVLALTSGAALLVMGGLVALALTGRGARPSPAPDPLPAPLGAGSSAPNIPPGCTTSPDNPPRLVVDLGEAGVDFGRVKQGQSVEREVAFRNTGTGVLCLIQEGTPCGCVRLAYKDPTKRRYEPGESGAVVLTLNTEGHSGPQLKSFWIYTNEPDNPRHTWPVKADISQGVILSVGGLAFGRHRRDEPATAVVRLSSPKADAEWTVTEVIQGRLGNQEPTPLVFEVKPIADPSLTVLELSVHHPGRKQEGSWSAPVTIKTSHPDRPEISLLAFLDVVAPLLASPPVGVFGFVQSGMPKELLVKVVPTTSGAVFQVLEARVEGPPGAPAAPEGPGFTATLGKDEKDGLPQVRVAYDGKIRKAGQLEATLVLKTDLAEQQELRVPLRATVPEKAVIAPPAPPDGPEAH